MDCKQKSQENSENHRKATSVVLFFVLLDRYSTSAIASILVLFLHEKFNLDVDSSTIIYHSYLCLTYFLSILGSIIADNWWGQFKTLVCMSFVFSTGCLAVAVGTIQLLNVTLTIFVIVGFSIITIGAGCIKPCTQTLGGDQFKSDETKNLSLHFVMNYFVYNCGSIVSRLVSPILRADVKCFGSDDCYCLAFGVPGVLMTLAALSLMTGRKYLVRNKAGGNQLQKFSGCVWHAITTKFSSKISNSTHWMDASAEKFGAKLVHETKTILNVMVLFLPLPLFYALFDQQGSRWIFQAKLMDGDLGWFIIKPDQFTLFNPLISLFLIPLFEFVLYPLLKKVGFESPLQKATIGGFLAAFSFIVSSYIEFRLKECTLHVLWLLPQYFLMTSAEILITIPLMQFCYTEAPENMKSVLAAFRLLAVSLGNLIVVFVAGAEFVESQAQEFLIFAVLMIIDMTFFAVLSRNYKFSSEKEVPNAIY